MADAKYTAAKEAESLNLPPPYPGLSPNPPAPGFYPDPGLNPEARGIYPDPHINAGPGLYPDPGAKPSPGSYPDPGSYAGTPQQGPPPSPQHAAAGQPAAVTIVVPMVMGSEPTTMTCRSCNAEIVTKIKVTPNIWTHVIAGVFCLVGCWFCCWLPYCVASCQTREHYCPNCDAYIGSTGR